MRSALTQKKTLASRTSMSFEVHDSNTLETRSVCFVQQHSNSRKKSGPAFRPLVQIGSLNILQQQPIGEWDHHALGWWHCCERALVPQNHLKIVSQEERYPSQNKTWPGRKMSRQVIGELSESRQSAVRDGAVNPKSGLDSHSKEQTKLLSSSSALH